MALINNFRYRPEIDGLRAIAVLAVVLFHAEFGCPGGYIGVDVFFVISGFLITSLIWKDLEGGRFSIVNFWERRARRIVPALVVVTLAILGTGWFLLAPPDFKSLGRASASQAVFMANVHYWRDTGYFGGASVEKPLLHTWSLAVEEQFYLVVPGLMWLMFFLPNFRTRKGVIFILSLGWILSFVLSVYGMSLSPGFTFYMLPTRAWELLTGSLFAFIGFPLALAKRQYLREALALIGLALIAIPVFVYTQKTPFPGPLALPPCLGAALFIWANKRSETADKDAIPPSFAGRCLAAKPVVFIGLISYSFYLWHWPFLAFSHYRILSPLSAGYRATMVGLGFVCAVLSWKFIETPFRERRVGSSRRSVFAFAGSGLILVFALGLLCVLRQGFPGRFSEQAQKFASVSTDTSDMGFNKSLRASDVQADKLVRIGATDPQLPLNILVWGDSHAMSALPAIDAVLKEKGWAGVAAPRIAAAPVLGWSLEAQLVADPAISFNDAVLDNIRKHRYRQVILIAHWRGYTNQDNYTPEFNAGLLKTVQSVVKAGSHPILLLDVPDAKFNVPRALWLSEISHGSIESYYKKPSDADIIDHFKPVTLAELRAAGAEILNPKSEFLDPTKQHYLVTKGDVVLYYDENHLTAMGAKTMLTPFFREKVFSKVRNQK